MADVDLVDVLEHSGVLELRWSRTVFLSGIGSVTLSVNLDFVAGLVHQLHCLAASHADNLERSPT